MESKLYYILKLGSYEGELSSLSCWADGNSFMYVVLCVADKSAEIIDWGYPTREALLEAWHNVRFQNADS